MALYSVNGVLIDTAMVDEVILYVNGLVIFFPASAWTTGSTCWGHSTGVEEDNTHTLAGNWTGTGTISGSGDSEIITLNPGEYNESEIVNTGAVTVTLEQNKYVSGDTVTLKYRTAATSEGIAAESWTTYSAPFASDGYAQVRIEGV